MKESMFIKYYKKRNKSKNYKEAKEKIDLFWNVLLKALEEESVILKNWGTFEKKEVKARKVIKFRAGKGLRNIVNGVDADE